MSDALARDDAARRRIRDDLDTSLVVEAAAGTGKTTMLVDRLVAVLASGRAEVDGLVAVTFTRKAAGELKLRLRQALDNARTEADDATRRAALEAAIARLEEAHIGTIHAFCAELLRQRPIEAGIDPAFVEIDEDEAGRFFSQVFRRFIEHRLDRLTPGLRRALSRLANQRSFDGSTPLDRLHGAARSLIDWRDFPAPWRREPFDRPAEVARLIIDVKALAKVARKNRNQRDALRKALEPAIALGEWVAHGERAVEGTELDLDVDDLEARLIELWRALRRDKRKGRSKVYADNIPRTDVVASRDRLLDDLETFAEAADADLAAELRTELREVIDEYERLKQRTGRVDFLDLLLRSRDLLRDDAQVRAYFQERFSHIFVDEFQDTDPLQAEILLLLAAADPSIDDWRHATPAPGKLFLVGDPKQSIYRFRRADMVLYQSVKDRLTANDSSDAELVRLTRSFRAVEPLQQTVNAAFQREMTGDRDSGQPEYVPLDPHRASHGDQPTLVALPVPSPYSWSRITARAIDESLPDAVAAWVAWLVQESGWKVFDREMDEWVGVQPRHVAILFRRFMTFGRDVTRDYVRGLENRGVPHLLVGGRSFHHREEVEILRAALTAIEWPDDELAVFATLKGGLFAIGDDLLLRFKQEIGTLHPLRFRAEDTAEESRVAPELQPILEALVMLRRLHLRRNRRPIVETVRELLAATRAHAGFALYPAGNQVLANVQRICDLARGFEMRGGLSFRGFVEQLTAEAERPGSGHAPVLEEGADGVRMMTVHAAKGLEFPVVVLADPTCRLHTEQPGQHVDPERSLAAIRLLGLTPHELRENAERESERDRAEAVRLAYVAATRARDLLVVPAVGDEPYANGWLEPLYPALYPSKETWREPIERRPEFGSSSVLQRPQSFDGEADFSVHPGTHESTAGNRVLWWDPAVLKPVERGPQGVEGVDLLREDGAAAEQGIRKYRRWKDRHRLVIEEGSKPSFAVAAVSTTDREAPDAWALDVQVEALDKAPGRPSGKRFGTLVHTVLRDVPLDGDESTTRDLLVMHGKPLAATIDDIEAAADAVVATLAHPLMRRAARAERLHREAPFILPLDDGTLIEGVIDLVFRDGDGWVVIDFKTDANVEGLVDSYRQQVAWYVTAIKAQTDEPVRGVLLSI